MLSVQCVGPMIRTQAHSGQLTCTRWGWGGGGGLTSIVDIYLISTLQFTNTYLGNRKHVPCFYRVIETRVEVWENEKCCGNTSRRRVFPQLLLVLPNFHECFYNSIETGRTCFLFLLENTATKKKTKTAC